MSQITFNRGPNTDPYPAAKPDPTVVPDFTSGQVDATGNQGVKFDTGKIRMELIPPELMTAVGEILTFGAEKYSARNWELGMDWSRPYGAMQRHMTAWWGGQENDPETGKSHLWHAGCCMAFLITYEMRGTGNDDRPQTFADIGVAAE